MWQPGHKESLDYVRGAFKFILRVHEEFLAGKSLN